MGTSLQLQVVSTYTGSRKMLLLISSIFLPALLQMASAQENIGEFYVCDNGNTVIAEWMCAWIEHLDQFSCVNGKVGLTVEDRNIIGAHWECDGFVGSAVRSGNDFGLDGFPENHDHSGWGSGSGMGSGFDGSGSGEVEDFEEVSGSGEVEDFEEVSGSGEVEDFEEVSGSGEVEDFEEV